MKTTDKQTVETTVETTKQPKLRIDAAPSLRLRSGVRAGCAGDGGGRHRSGGDYQG
jgi:hypothetical protein